MKNLLLCSAVQLGKMIREKQVSCEEVVRTYIGQATKVNPILNAIVVNRFEQAVQDAKAVDLFLKNDPDEVPALLGVPFTIKESYPVKGMPCTLGSVHMKDNISKADHAVVARLKAAGAIPLGITNVPLLLRGAESSNKLYGRTRNPHDLERTSGGSSGGESAIISAAGSAFGIGSDGAGSIRGPSNFCGIFGHKSSSGLIRETAEIPTDFHAKIAYGLAVNGPMTRFSEDLMPLLRIMAGDMSDGMEIGDETKVNIKDLDYYFTSFEGLDPSVKKAHENAIDVLKKEGIKFSEISADKFKDAQNILVTYFQNALSLKLSLETLGIGSISDVYKFLEREKAYGDTDFNVLTMNYIISAVEQSKEERDKYLRMGVELKEQFDEILGPKGVIISPARMHPAFFLGEAVKQFEFTWMLGIYNVLQYAATAIPMGLNDEGLPVGIQAVAWKGNDHLTIALARFYESKGYGWIRPKMVE